MLNGSDNCPNRSNSSQTDADGDGVGDACDQVDDRLTGEGGVDASYTTSICTQVMPFDAFPPGSPHMHFTFSGAEIAETMSNSSLNFIEDSGGVQGGVALVDGGMPGDSRAVYRITGTLYPKERFSLAIPQLKASTGGDISLQYALKDSLGDMCDPQSKVIGNGAASDSDSDGVLAGDNCPFVANEDQNDFDGDEAGDECDSDDDNDGVPDIEDSCPLLADVEQSDFDRDGLGNPCDPDDDNDGVLDEEDVFPLDPTRSTEPLKGIQYLQTTSDLSLIHI